MADTDSGEAQLADVDARRLPAPLVSLGSFIFNAAAGALTYFLEGNIESRVNATMKENRGQAFSLAMEPAASASKNPDLMFLAAWLRMEAARVMDRVIGGDAGPIFYTTDGSSGCGRRRLTGRFRIYRC